MEYKRKDSQTKKEFYRRLAQIRKNNWAHNHHYGENESIKSHFIANDDSCSTDDKKSKKIMKVQHRTQQRLRNRVAAQQSRERHRFYVEELEKKVKMYEELLKQQEVLCKNCKKNMLTENNQIETIVAQDISDQSMSQSLLNPKVSQQEILSSYLDDQLIRIDNNQSATPFGIFFVICLVAILAIFSFNISSTDITPRLLANYQSKVTYLISMQDTKLQTNTFTQSPPKLIELTQMQVNDRMNSLNREVLYKVQEPPHLELSERSTKNWTKYGDYICSQPQIIVNNRSTKSQKRPEFLLLRTGRNSPKPLKRLKVPLDDKQSHRINIQSNEWVQISSCFLGDLNSSP